MAGSYELAVDLGHRRVAPIFPTRAAANIFTTTYPDSNTAYVYNVFHALLEHDPTPAEISYHVNTLNTGYNRVDYSHRRSTTARKHFAYQVDQIYRTVP